MTTLSAEASNDRRSLCRGAVGLALLILVPLNAVAQTPSPSAKTGIEGVVLVSPARGGAVRQGVPNTAPVANVTFVVKKAQQAVTSFTTDSAGRFHVPLAPGHYTISRRNNSSRIGSWRFEADVAAGQMTKVRWIADSGIR